MSKPETPNFYQSWASESDRPVEKDTFDADAAGADWLDEGGPIDPDAFQNLKSPAPGWAGGPEDGRTQYGV